MTSEQAWQELQVAVDTLWEKLLRTPLRIAYKILELPSQLRNYYERARYGVGHLDIWSFDHYLSTTIARGLRILADEGKSVHTFDLAHDYIFPDAHDLAGWERLSEAGNVELRDRARQLEGYANAWAAETVEEEDVLVSEAADAMHWVARNFMALWD